MLKKINLIIAVCLIGQAAIAQKINWQNLDYEKDSVYGISIDKAYRELLQDKKTVKVIVGIIDTGIDTLHEDLNAVLWHENALYGWNFLGGVNGQMKKAPLELERQYYRLSKIFAGRKAQRIPKTQQRDYQLWQQVKLKFQADSMKMTRSSELMFRQYSQTDSSIRKSIGKEQYTYADIAAAENKELANSLLAQLLSFDKQKTNTTFLQDKQKDIEFAIQYYQFKEDPLLKRQRITGDDYYNFNDKNYGNSNVMDIGGHGSHVAGIIGALRGNGKGIDGIANAVELMTIRAVPREGDEYDKDVALAIRYAVNHGAKVINMSFAKYYSPEQQWVEDAIRYAAKNDVLLIKGAGNDATDIDQKPMYPTAAYIGKTTSAPNVITVGASGYTPENLVAPFSNYGKNGVDVFAPGVNIYSCAPGAGQYITESGTSMAAPVVAGLAAVLRSYYPKLSAVQVKHIIESSVSKIDFPVLKPGKQKIHVAMKELCRSGGIVNAYKALLMAEQ